MSINIIDITKHSQKEWETFLETVEHTALKDAQEGESWIKPKKITQKDLLAGVIFRCLRGLFFN